MAQIGDADAAGEIEHFASTGHGHVGAGTALNDLSRQSTNSPRNMAGAELCQLGDAHDGQTDGGASTRRIKESARRSIARALESWVK